MADNDKTKPIVAHTIRRTALDGEVYASVKDLQLMVIMIRSLQIDKKHLIKLLLKLNNTSDVLESIGWATGESLHRGSEGTEGANADEIRASGKTSGVRPNPKPDCSEKGSNA